MRGRRICARKMPGIAALRHLETLELGLKQHARKILAIRMNDPTFTEKMAAPPERVGLTAVNKKSA